MRKLALGAIVILSACGSDDQLIETVGVTIPPTTGSELTTTTTEAPPTTTTTEPEPVVEEEPVATTVVYSPPSTARYLREQATTVPERSSSSQLASIRACESHGDYSTDTGNGYYGAYQFAQSTWESVGGSGNPADASPSEQDMRAQMMIDAGRRGEWPNC